MFAHKSNSPIHMPSPQATELSLEKRIPFKSRYIDQGFLGAEHTIRVKVAQDVTAILGHSPSA